MPDRNGTTSQTLSEEELTAKFLLHRNLGDGGEGVSPHTQGTDRRVLGLDIGDRRVGVAISGPSGTALGMTAQPLLTLVRSTLRHDLKSLGRLIRKHNVTEVVAGNPLHMSGDLSPQAIKAQSFAEAVRQEFGLPLHLWDERLTTTEAHRQLDTLGHEKIGRKGIIDQVAAVLILQAFLDRRTLEQDRSAGCDAP